jgi:hypothetical protein
VVIKSLTPRLVFPLPTALYLLAIRLNADEEVRGIFGFWAHLDSAFHQIEVIPCVKRAQQGPASPITRKLRLTESNTLQKIRFNAALAATSLAID